MSFYVQFNTLHLQHNDTQLRFSVSTVLQFRYPLGVENPTMRKPTLDNLHLFWIQSNGPVTLSLRFSSLNQSYTGFPLDHAVGVLCNSSLWRCVGFRVSMTESWIIEDSIRLTLQRDLGDHDFAATGKINKLCFDISPENLRPPHGIDCLELVQIQCIIDRVETNWDLANDHLFDHEIADAFQTDDDVPVEENLFSASETMTICSDIEMDGTMFNTYEEAKPMLDDDHTIFNVTHLLEATCYVLFQGSNALPTDISLLQDMAPGCLTTFIPSLFDVDYIKNMSNRLSLMQIMDQSLSKGILPRARSSTLKLKFTRLITSNDAKSCQRQPEITSIPASFSTQMWDLTARQFVGYDTTTRPPQDH